MEARTWMVATMATTLLWPVVLWQHWPEHSVLIALAALFCADAGSYVFHYIVDWYGDADRSGLAREFQKHHAQPDGIAEATVLEVLHPVARLVVPAWALAAAVTAFGWLPPSVALAVALIGAAWCYGQLAHRWTHMRQPPRLARLLQGLCLIVSPNAHRLHHIPPYSSHYAVITGWSNPLFDFLRLPRLIDRVLQGVGFEKRPATQSVGGG